VSEQSNVVSINYAPNPLNVKRRLNKLVVVSLVGALLCAMISAFLFVDVGLGERLHPLSLVILPYMVEFGIAGFAWRRVRENRDYQREQSTVTVAILIAGIAALLSIYLSSTVQDRMGVNDPSAIDVLTVNKTWNPPSGARVVRTRSMSMGPYIWYELEIPLNSVASYQQAVIAHAGPATSTASTAASLRALHEEEDPDWWDISAMPGAQALTFSGHPTDVYVFSANKGRVLVRQLNTDS